MIKHKLTKRDFENDAFFITLSKWKKQRVLHNAGLLKGAEKQRFIKEKSRRKKINKKRRG